MLIFPSTDSVMMLKPLAIIKVAILESKGIKNVSKLQITLGDHRFETTQYMNSRLDAIFPVEHCFKQKFIINIHNLDGQIFNITEDLERVAKQRLVNDWYQIHQNSGKLKIVFEAVPITNSRRAISESRAFGVLSILLKQLKGRVKTRPVVFLDLQEGQKSQKWSSLEPLCSAKTQDFNEGTLLHVQNVLDETSKLKIRIWDAKSSTWMGDQKGFNVKTLLRYSVKDGEIRLSNGALFTFSVSLYHF